MAGAIEVVRSQAGAWERGFIFVRVRLGFFHRGLIRHDRSCRDRNRRDRRIRVDLNLSRSHRQNDRRLNGLVRRVHGYRRFRRGWNGF